MYTIIGGDGKEYGPVTADQIRSWIAGGRANLDTKAKTVGSLEWKSLGEFEDFAPGGVRPAPSFGGAASVPPFGGVAASPQVNPVASLELGSCYDRAWELLKANFWPLVGAGVLVLILPSAISIPLRPLIGVPLSGSVALHGDNPADIFSSPAFPVVMKSMSFSLVVALFFSYPLWIGFYYYLLKKARGEMSSISDVFSGFSSAYLPLVGSAVLMGILIGIGFCVFILPGIYLAVAYSMTPILIIDRKLDVWTAMETSRRTVSRHWWTIFGIAIVGFMLAIVGFVALIVGIFVALPLIYTAKIYAYVDLFPRQSVQAPGP